MCVRQLNFREILVDLKSQAFKHVFSNCLIMISLMRRQIFYHMVLESYQRENNKVCDRT